MIAYNIEDNPTEEGVYACRVPSLTMPDLLDDVFLIWSEGRWWQRNLYYEYRGEIIGWIGPLQRKMQANQPIREGVPHES